MIDRPACYPHPPATLASAGRIVRRCSTSSPHRCLRAFSIRRWTAVTCSAFIWAIRCRCPIAWTATNGKACGSTASSAWCRPARARAGSCPGLRDRYCSDWRRRCCRKPPMRWASDARDADLAPSIHVRDPQIERIGWMMQAEDHDAYPGGRLFADSLGSALAARLLALQSRKRDADGKPARALPPWRSATRARIHRSASGRGFVALRTRGRGGIQPVALQTAVQASRRHAGASFRARAARRARRVRCCCKAKRA